MNGSLDDGLVERAHEQRQPDDDEDGDGSRRPGGAEPSRVRKLLGASGASRMTGPAQGLTGQGVSTTLPGMCVVDLAMKAWRASASG